MRAILVALLFAALALAGCTNNAPDEPLDTGSSEEQTEAEPAFGPHSGLPESIDQAAPRTLDESPDWVLGEWWEIELTSHFDGSVTTFKRIVAGLEGANFLVGQPLDEFNDEVMIMHFPGFGLVNSKTLGYEAHDYMFEPMQFPVTVGDSWQSLWQGANAVMTHNTVERDDEAGIAKFQASTNNQQLSYTYDAEMGAIVEFVAPGYASYKVLDHGFEYEGIARVPHGHDLTFFHGRLGPAVPVSQSGTLGLPDETITVLEQYDRASFILGAFELAPFLGAPEPPAGSGVSSITATGPDGEEFAMTKLPTEAGHKIQSYYHDAPAGDWTLEVIAASGQQVFMEGVSYVVFDVVLPEGCVLQTSKVHDHGGDCGGHVHGIS